MNEDIRNTPLFNYLAQELRGLTNIIADRDLDLRMLNRRVNQLEDYTRELEWRMESYEAFTTRMLQEEPQLSTEAINMVVGDTDYYSEDLLNLLNEVVGDAETEVDDDFDWNDWFYNELEL